MTNYPDTPGLRLVSSALAFCKAAKLLHLDDPNSDAWAPCFVNLGLAIELGLKGYLREQGMTEAKQKAFGVHASALKRAGISELAEGQRVAVDMVEGGKGPEAGSIRLI